MKWNCQNDDFQFIRMLRSGLLYLKLLFLLKNFRQNSNSIWNTTIIITLKLNWIGYILFNLEFKLDLLFESFSFFQNFRIFVLTCYWLLWLIFLFYTKFYFNLVIILDIKYTNTIIPISEIGIDMSYFYISKYLCCWAGLTPDSNESSGKKKAIRITRTEAYLKHEYRIFM